MECNVTATEMREKIHDLVSALHPFDEVEKGHIDFVLDWIGSGAELFRIEKPAQPPIHLVSYFLVYAPEQSKILLVDHKKAGLWLPSGGHVEINEDPIETVAREAKEELGIEAEFLSEFPLFVTVTKTVGNVTPHTDVSLWYLLRGDPGDILTIDREEFHQIRWFGLDEIPFDRTDPHLGRFIKKMRIYEGKT